MTNIYIYIYQKSIYRGTLSVTVTGPTEIKHNGQKTGFMCYKHSFIAKGPYTLMLYNGYVISDRRYIRFLIGSIHGVSNWDFRNRGVRGYDVVYVYFYGEDPRPLLFCYNNKAYAAQTKDSYFEKWINVTEIKNCVCEGAGENEPLLKELVRVVGFLNRVELQMHPSGTDGKECSSSSGALSEGSTCPDKNGKTCKYVVHEHEKKLLQVRMPMERRVVQSPVDSRLVKVRVKCEDVTPGNDTCYKKLIHDPVGFNGQGSGSGDGYRLGGIVYKGNDGREKGEIQYYPSSTSNGVENGDTTNKSSHWWKPLVKVTVYFYNEDTKYLDPLLVVLEFKNNVEGEGNVYEWYRLKMTSELGDMRWEKDETASCKMRYTLFKYLDGIRYDLKKVLKVKLECKGGTTYKAMGRAAGTDNVFEQLNGKEVDVCKDVTCSKLAEHKYKCYVHRIQEALTGIHDQVAGVAFTIPSADGYKVIELYNITADGTEATCTNGENGATDGSAATCTNGTPINPTYNKCMGDIYVYFYGSDPRPLMLCYGGNAYGPKCMADYECKWVKVDGVEKCECSDKGECEECDKLLKDLVDVSNFLNPVKIDQINGEETSYVIHEFKGEKIKINLQEQKSDGTFCYKKYTHTHNGIGSGGEGFRLGNIEYRGECIQEIGAKGPNGGKCITSVLENGDTTKKYTSASEVVVYYYKEDKGYKDPLLVELQFKNGTANDKEYYKLTRREPGKMEWQKDTGASEIVEGNGEKLVKHLDEIRYGIKKVLKVEISQKGGTTYKAMGRDAKPSEMNVFGPISGAGGKKIDVAECSEGTCPQLNTLGYKCFVHKISQLGGDFDYNEIAGVAFTIPGEGGEPIEIKLFNVSTADANCNNGQNGNQVTSTPQLTYNKCMGDVYVFFYNGSGGDVKPAQVDSVPLILWYDNSYYKPCNRESYFTKWVQVKGLVSAGEPCEGVDVGTLAEQLNKVNKALNRIDLDPDKATGDGYGLPEEGKGSSGDTVKVDTLYFKTDRVNLKKQQGPEQPPNNPAYVKVVHRTVNGFTIGEIRYNGQDFATSGVKINGASGDPVTIKVNNGNHKELVAGKKWNTVVAYYSKSDSGLKLPQLIVILKTDSEVSGGTVTSVKGTDYGYYILTNKNGGNDYEYVWHPVTNGPGQKVTLNDATDFSLLNSVVILLEQQCKNGSETTYKDDEIKPAITSAKLSSPGNEEGVNRITNKTITVSDATGTEGACLNKTGFKVIIHDITKLVKPDESVKGKLGSTTLIAGLRFLIPTSEKNSYTQLTVSDSGTSGTSNGTELFLYHKPNGGENKTKICVYFYGDDPRPLLLCYSGSAYRSTIKNNYFDRWDKDSSISSCDCKNAKVDKLLPALVNVSNFLNPLNIKYVPRRNYKCAFNDIHWFNGNTISIKVTSEKAKDGFCYNKYTHTHDGTCNKGGAGFRLGDIKYDTDCIKESNSGTKGNCITSQLVNSHPYTAASKVVVFYYQGDTALERPLLVALCKNSSDSCNLYYELQKGDEASSGAKKYIKGTNSIKLEDKANSELETKLDEIRSKITKHLQIIIDKRPVIQLYKPNEASKCNESATYKNQNEGLKCLREMDHRILNCEIIEKSGGPKICVFKDKTDKPPTYHLPTKTCYKAQFYENGKPVSSEPKDTSIKVKEIRCKELELHGYRCYEHDVVNAKDIYEIGWLRFYLWDNTSGGSGSCPSSADGSEAKCKELCLYKESSSDSPPGTQVSCPATANSESTQTSCTPDKKDLELVNTTYTTCKGNVFVYFYGDDPRPLMLCYDGNAYGPRCKDEYECKWVCVAA